MSALTPTSQNMDYSSGDFFLVDSVESNIRQQRKNHLYATVYQNVQYSTDHSTMQSTSFDLSLPAS